MNNVAFKVFTPSGVFEARWDDLESSRAQYVGEEAAIEFFKDFMMVNMVTGHHGHRLSFDNVGAYNFYWFCKPAAKDYGILVLDDANDAVQEFLHRERE